jgi:hypothetical protein
MKNTIIQTIKNGEKVELTDTDIGKILGDPQPNILIYSDLFDYNTIDQVLGGKGYVILLYSIRGKYDGHWTCLFRQKDYLVFFDSYGLAPDEEIQFIPDFQSLDNRGQSVPHFTKLLDESGYKVLYNTHQYQSDKKDINTCGRHTCVRLKFCDLTPDEYHQLMAIKDTDFYVSALTLLYSL